MNAAGRATRSILITVKTYPNPSTTYEETVCVAGIDISTHKWVRLYPVTFRALPFDQQFKKYEIVSVVLERHPRDPRPESYRPDPVTMRVVDQVAAGGDWSARREIVEPAASESMCAIQQEQEANRKSLGCFRPAEVTDFVIKDDAPEWTGKQRSALLQLSLFETEREPLEKIPLRFYYVYRCGSPSCRGHRQSLIDWEPCQLYRNLQAKGDSLETIKSKIREKFLDDLCSPARDTYFFVGNHSAHPKSFMVLGVFYPLKREPTLFDDLLEPS